MDASEFLDESLTFLGKLEVAFATIFFSGLTADQFSFDQPVYNINRRMMLYLKSLAQLRNGEVF
jgi:hypothetical protein